VPGGSKCARDAIQIVVPFPLILLYVRDNEGLHCSVHPFRGVVLGSVKRIVIGFYSAIFQEILKLATPPKLHPIVDDDVFRHSEH
jgi:hypothetical protein